MNQTYLVTTPEHVTFEFEVAGFFSRLLAWLMDVIVIGVLTLVASIAAQAFVVLSEAFAQTVYTILFFVISWGYFVFLEWFWGGQSLGKRAVGLRVLSDDGVRITIWQSAIRNLFRVLDSLPVLYLIGGSVALLSQGGRRLGDLAAGTIVVQEKESPMPDEVVPPKERFNSFLQEPILVQKVLARITPEERDFLVDLALRREALPLSRRLLLYERMAEHLEKNLAVPRPEFFSHERYCLNITAILLRGEGWKTRGRR